MSVAVITLPFSPVLLVYVALMKMGSWIIPLVTSYLPHDPHGVGGRKHLADPLGP